MYCCPERHETPDRLRHVKHRIRQYKFTPPEKAPATNLKTTTTANIGTALAALGNKVVVKDGDTGLRNLDVLMGLENRIVYTIIDVIENRCRLKQALIKDKRYPSLCLLPTAQTKDNVSIISDISNISPL